MTTSLIIPSPLETVNYDLFKKHNISVSIKRDDLIHPEISGNKWRKLKLNIEKCKQGKYDGLLTFGGAYSNHISATAATGKALNLPTIGIIRGDELNENSNETLQTAVKNEMQLQFVTRSEYSLRYEKSYHHELRRKFGNVLIVEEGGANYHGMMGCVDIITEIDKQPDYYILAAGTGTTSAGLLIGSNTAQIISVPVFKNGGFIADEIKKLLINAGLGIEEIQEKMNQLTLATEFSFGGYGKFTPELIQFINHIYTKTQLKLDQIYTGKMFYTLCEKIKTGEIPKNSSVIAIHTGGLQGLSSIKDQLVFQI